MYLQYGDKGVLETNYPMIQKWLGYLDSETTDDLLLDHKSHAMGMQVWNFLGDWVTPEGKLRRSQPGSPACTAHQQYSLRLPA